MSSVAVLRSLLLPSQADTQLLRACLLRGESARAALSAWSTPPARPLAELQTNGGLKRRLLPLLQANLEREGFPAPAELQAPLRAATLYEQLRTEAYREIAANAFSALNHSGLPYLAMRAAVFNWTIYRKEERRHCHDIDLLLPQEHLAPAAYLLTRTCGFELRQQASVPRSSILMFHASGLPLMLHGQALPSPAFQLSWQRLWDGRRSAACSGIDVATPNPAMALLQALLHGPFVPQGRSLVWVCDAWNLIDRSEVDWDAFSAAIAGGAETLTVLLILQFLSLELRADVPTGVLHRLHERWAGLPRSDQNTAADVLLLVLLQQAVVGKRALWQEAWRLGQPASVLRTMLAPSSKALRQTGRIRRGSEAPAFWMRELLNTLRRCVGGTPPLLQRDKEASPETPAPVSSPRNDGSLR